MCRSREVRLRFLMSSVATRNSGTRLARRGHPTRVVRPPIHRGPVMDRRGVQPRACQCANGGLKNHEKTLASREALFETFLEKVGFHRNPFCACGPTMRHLPPRPTPGEHWAGTSPTMTADGIRHEVGASLRMVRWGSAWPNLGRPPHSVSGRWAPARVLSTLGQSPSRFGGLGTFGVVVLKVSAFWDTTRKFAAWNCHRGV